jgi:signal transduction histidine kinase
MNPAAKPAHDPLAGGGQMGALMRSIDWANTAVGPVASWPQSLRTALSILLETGFPMYIAWGAEFTQFYNDGYRPILGSTKHPAAMGISTRETFAEIWTIIGPMFRDVMSGQSTTVVDFMLPLDRHGFAEECYFVFSYSPIREESGEVGGVLVTVSETTGRVLGARRLATLQALAADTRDARTVADACALAARVLDHNAADLPFARIYLLDHDRARAHLAGAAGAGPDAPTAAAMDMSGTATPWPLGEVVRTRQPAIVEGGGSGRVMVLPVMRQGADSALGLLVAAVSPRLLLDDDYRTFLSLVAAQIGTAIASAQALEDAKARADALAELDRAKTAFFSNVSHEFRTPLTLLLGPIENALAAPDGTLDREQLSLVHRNALRLLRLVNTLLDFSRIEAGRTQASFEPADVASLTREVASAFRSLIEQAGLRLEIACDAVSAPVYLDVAMWEQVVLNLLSNAFKFTFAGGVTVALREIDGAFELEVRDTGTGIPQAELPHLFDRFRRVEGARSRSFEGSGIGLALVLELVRMHGGTIDVESEEGVGTAFVVRVPTGTRHLGPGQLAMPRERPARDRVAAPFVEEARRWSVRGERDRPARLPPLSPSRIRTCASWWSTTTRTCATTCGVCWRRTGGCSPSPTATPRWPRWRRRPSIWC